MKNDIKDGFLTDTSRKENAYLLGLLWADGWIINEGYMHSVRLQMVKDDFLLIEPLFRMMGIEVYYERQRTKNGKTFGKVSKMTCIQDKSIIDFLIQNEYDKKSGYAPTKILSLIPENLHHYFWRGYVDGDGCISAKKIEIWSVLDQDWCEAISLADKLEVSYSIYTYHRRGGKHCSSVFYMGGIGNAVKFGDFLYQDYDGIGLLRKYNKYIQLKEKQKMMPLKTSQYKGVFFASKMKKWGSSYYDSHNKKQKHLGWFLTEQDAFDALQKFRKCFQ